MRKTTKKEYDSFRREFLRLIDLLGLTRYTILFTHSKDNANFSTLTVDEPNKKAVVNFTTTLNPEDLVEFDPKDHGRHEAIHLLLWRLAWLASLRYVRREEIDEEEESIVRLLTKIL